MAKNRQNEKLFQLWYCTRSGGFTLLTNSFCEFSNSSQLKNSEELRFEKNKASPMKLCVNIIFLKKSGEKSPNRKTILTMVLHQKWRFFTYNKFFLGILKPIAIEKF